MAGTAPIASRLKSLTSPTGIATIRMAMGGQCYDYHHETSLSKELGKIALSIFHLLQPAPVVTLALDILVKSCKNINLVEYEQMKDKLQQIEILLKEREMEAQLRKNLLSEKQEMISNLEQALVKCRSELAEQVKRLNDALQIEKKNETLTKEEELNKDDQALLKQIEDLKSRRKTIVDSSADQATKEKDTRIQVHIIS
ncbi:hypothetical protein COCNU_01G009460 [Cocos nucifera]|uniref:Uncharacterized protein n=1 Tax=Cocos nucifera TaxID=13894 RepID=A0A8K0MUN8_COCNU|nr:hypothetical protein COCNU_01G009460 [Cocos nucifera]